MAATKPRVFARAVEKLAADSDDARVRHAQTPHWEPKS